MFIYVERNIDGWYMYTIHIFIIYARIIFICFGHKHNLGTEIEIIREHNSQLLYGHHFGTAISNFEMIMYGLLTHWDQVLNIKIFIFKMANPIWRPKSE